MSVLLVDDGINSNCSLSCLTVSDYKLSLSSSNRNHRVYSLYTGLKRLVHRLTENNSRSLSLQRHLKEFTLYTSLTVKRLAERVNNSAQHTLTYSYRCNSLGSLNGEALFDVISRTKEHRSYIVLLKVHHNGHLSVFKLQKFTRFRIAQAVNTNHSVTYLKNGSNLIQLNLSFNPLQLFTQNIGNFTCFNINCHN